MTNEAYKLKITTFAPVHIGDMLDFEPTNYVIYNADDENVPLPQPEQNEVVVCPECGYENELKKLRSSPYCSFCDTELELPKNEPAENSSSSKITGTAYLYTFTPKQLSDALSEADKKELLSVARKGDYRLLENFFKRKTAKIVPNATKHASVCPKVYVKYKEKFGNAEKQQGKRNQFVIEKNISNPATDTAYIPASSLKGAIRTAVFSEVNKQRHLTLEDIKIITDKGIRYETKDIENKIYNYKSPSDDPFKYLKISDTMLSTPYMTEICVAQNYLKLKPAMLKEDKECKNAYAYIEFIPHGTDFTAELAIDTRFDWDIESIGQACNAFYGALLEKEQRYMCDIHNIPAVFYARIKQALQKPNTFLLRVGKYSGAESVTIDGLRNIKVRHGSKYPEYLDHSTSCWLAENGRERLPFGWCVAEVEKIR